MGWVALPTGKEIAVKKGSTYAASVSTGHSEADIRSFAAKHGLQIYSYSSQPGGALVAGTATADGNIPWGVPSWLRWADDSHAIAAWVNSTGGTPTPPGGEVPSKPVPLTPVYIAAGLIAGAGVGWWLWRRKK